MNDKEKFVIEYLKREQYVDVLDKYFMDEFADRFNCKYTYMPIGANRVPLAGKTLSTMFKKGLLDRFVVGISDYAGGQGFPKWVYCYSMAKPNTASTRQGVGVANESHNPVTPCG